MKPILFNTEMVRAILAGQKTVTRRVMKPQPVHEKGFWKVYGAGWSDNIRSVAPVYGHSLYTNAPYNPGDTLWVQEDWNWGIIDRTDYEGRSNYYWFEELQRGKKSFGNLGAYYYRADYTEEEWAEVEDMKWHSAIFMSRDAARIFLRVTDVRVERLQDIQERGKWSAKDEGFVYDINFDAGTGKSAVGHFAEFWESTIKPEDRDKYGWEANPFVWVIGFERIEKP